MYKRECLRLAAVLFLGVMVVGCSSVEPVKYSGIDSSSYLHSNMDKDADHVPFRYTIQQNWSAYSKVIVDPVVIYAGADNQFGEMSEADKRDLANYLQTTVEKKLSPRYAVTQQPEPGAARIRLTLTGAEATTSFLGAFTHIDLGGNVYNAVQAARGGKAAFGGSVTYAVEVRDARSNQLLYADVTRQYPNAMNFGAAFGALSAAKTGIDKGADALAARLN